MRISKRHTDISMPLDLSDEETIGDHDVVNQAIQALDEDGWNNKGRWLRASWIVCASYLMDVVFANIHQRLRYTSLQFREEVLEFSLTKLDDNSRTQLL
jgi:hypothetical protein